MTQVGALSRALAIRTLQLELEYIYGCLEDEALDIGQGTQNPSFLLSRQVRPLFVGPLYKLYFLYDIFSTLHRP